MSSIAKRPDGQWRARYRDASGKEFSKHFALKRDAVAWLDSVTTSMATGTYAAPDKGRQTFAVIAERWFETQARWTETTRARNRSVLDTHVVPQWGRRRVSSIDSEELQRWVNDLSVTGLAPNTVRKVASVASGVFTYAVKPAKALGVSPMVDVKLPAQTQARRRYLSAAQVERLAAAAREHADVVFTLAYVGLRIGELSALRVRDVDFLRRRITVGASVTEVNGRLVWSTPKDKEERRVPIPAFLLDGLAARTTGRAPEDLLFPSPRGDVLRVRNMRRAWFDAAAREAGVPGLVPHELRHTAASLAVSSGASVLAVQRLLGHNKPSITLDVYSDLFDDDLDRLADSIADARAKAAADFLRTGGLVSLSQRRVVG